MIEVCIGSFYLIFLIIILLKDLLLFVALKYSDGELKDMFVLMALVDLIVFFTLPLFLISFGGICK